MSMCRPRMSKCLLAAVVCAAWCSVSGAQAQTGPLPSWNDGPAKEAIVEFVRATTDASSPQFVSTEKRIATFDQDGTLWVEKPTVLQLAYCLDHLPAVVEKKPELKNVEPFKTILSGDRAAIARLTMPDLEKLLVATLTGITTDQYQAEVKQWLAAAKDPRWKKPCNELTYQPMQEVLKYLAPTATRLTSSAAVARTSFASMPSRPTASRPSRSSAPSAARRMATTRTASRS